MTETKTALVTGGAGFIGSHVVDCLIVSGYKVIVLDDLSGGFKENINQKAIFIEGSITNNSLIKKIFDENKIDYVFHLAAYAAENLSHFIRKFNYENNLIGSINLVNASVTHQIKCFVFTSSIAAYGDIKSPMKEDDAPNPSDPYGIAKLAIEHDLKAAHKMFKLNYIIFRPHNVYGERQNMEDKYRNVVTIFINQILQDKPVTIFGDGEQTRGFSYVGDVAKTIAHSIEKLASYNHLFNIGSDDVISVAKLAEIIAQKLGADLKVNYLRERNEVKHAHADHSKIKKLVGHSPNVQLEEGLARTIAWAKKTGTRKTKQFSNIEINNNLPEGW